MEPNWMDLGYFVRDSFYSKNTIRRFLEKELFDKPKNGLYGISCGWAEYEVVEEDEKAKGLIDNIREAGNVEVKGEGDGLIVSPFIAQEFKNKRWNQW